MTQLHSLEQDFEFLHAGACEFPEAQLVQQCRTWFVSLLKASGIPKTDQTCVFASHFLRMTLLKFSGGLSDIEIMAGGPPDQTGFHLGGGQYAPHMWVSARLNGVLWYLDITADQFGLPEVIIAPAHVLADVYVPDNALAMKEHLESLYNQDPVLAQMAA